MLSVVVTTKNEAAKAEVDAREAAGEDEKAAAAAMVGAISPDKANAVTGTGKPAILSTDCPQRKLPTFEHALDEKTPPPDESNAYSKPVEQKQKLEEWSV